MMSFTGLEGTAVQAWLANAKQNSDVKTSGQRTALQVTSAVANIHKVIQDNNWSSQCCFWTFFRTSLLAFKDMADRGRLLPADFKYRPDKVRLNS